MNTENYALPVGSTDLQRMALLGNIYKPYNTQFVLDHGLTEGAHVADVGCGPGNMSLWMAEKVGAFGAVTAIDNSDEQLKILRHQLNLHNISNVTTKNINIYDLSCEYPQQFDLVYCRFLLVHLSDPFKAVEQLKKILKPQGRLIISELDNSTWSSYPISDSLKRDTNLLYQTGKLRGMDLNIGSRLYSIFNEFNFNDIKVSIAQPVLEEENREYIISKVRTWGQKYLEHKLITVKEFEDLFASIKDLALNKDHQLLGAKMYQVAGVK